MINKIIREQITIYKNKILRILFCIVTVAFVTAFFHIGSTKKIMPDYSFALSSDSLTVAPSTFAGSGSEESPYLISSSAQLVELSSLVNGLYCRDDGKPYSVCSYRLSENIDMTNVPFEPIGKSDSSVELYVRISPQVISTFQSIADNPICWAQLKFFVYEKNGTEYVLTGLSEYVPGIDYYFKHNITNAFYGTFDGNGKSIDNLSVNSVNSGLFATLTNASITNVTLNNASVTGSEVCGGIAAALIDSEVVECKVVNSEIISSSDNSICGGIIGNAYGNDVPDITIYESDGVTVYLQITKNDLIPEYVNTSKLGKVSQCLNNGSTITAGLYSGGIIGQTLASENLHVICEAVDCLNYADVNSLSANGYAGGIVGYSTDIIANCLSLKSGISDVPENGNALVGGTPLANAEEYFSNSCYSCYYPSELISDSNLNLSTTTSDIFFSYSPFTSQGSNWIIVPNDGNTHYYPSLSADFAVPFSGYTVSVYDSTSNLAPTIINSKYGIFTLPSESGYYYPTTGYEVLGFSLDGIDYDFGETIQITHDSEFLPRLILLDFNVQITNSNTNPIYNGENITIAQVDYQWDYDAVISPSYQWYYSVDDSSYSVYNLLSGNELILKNVIQSGYYYCKVTLSDGVNQTEKSSNAIYADISRKSATATITSEITETVYTGNSIAVNPSISYSDIYEGDIDSFNVVFDIPLVLSANTYTITADISHPDYLFNVIPLEFTVTPATMTYTISDVSEIYSGSSFYPNLTVQTVDNSDYSVFYSLDGNSYNNEIDSSDVGNYYFYVYVTAPNHTDCNLTGNVTVTPNEITLIKRDNAPLITKTYDSSYDCPVEKITNEHYTASLSGEFSGVLPLTISSARFGVSHAADTMVTASFVLNDVNNFTVNTDSLTFNAKINRAKITVSKKIEQEFSKLYDKTADYPILSFFDISPYLTVVADYYSYNLTVSESYFNSANVGEANSLIVKFGITSNNYTFTKNGNTVAFPARIFPRELKIQEGSVKVCDKEYDGTNIINFSGGILELKHVDYSFKLDENLSLNILNATVNDANASDSPKSVYFESVSVDNDNYLIEDNISGNLSVFINKTTPTLSPTCVTEIFSNATVLPDIGISENDTPGVIEWNDYTIDGSLSKQSFSWAFTPYDTTNYMPTTGTIELTLIKTMPESLQVTYNGRTQYSAFERFDSNGLTVYVLYNDGSSDKLEIRTLYDNGYYVYYDDDRDYFINNDEKVSVRYEINDSVLETFVNVTVSPIVLNLPEVIGQYVYSGKNITLRLNNFSPEIMAISGNAQTEAGQYTASVTLKDSENYRWNSLDNSNIDISWEILRAPKHMLSVKSTEFVYNGNVITLQIINNDLSKDFYTLSGTTSSSEAGEYSVTVSFVSDNYYWLETNNSNPIIFNWSILPKTVNLPEIFGEPFYFDGTTQNITVTQSEFYDVSGELSFLDSGTHFITATLKDASNYVWANGNKSSVSLPYEVLKPKLQKPSYSANYTYNGSVFSIPLFSNSLYKVGGQVSATDAGDYILTVSLKDVNNTLWDDDTSDPIDIKWSIRKLTLISPKLNGESNYNGQSQTAFIVYDAKFCSISGNIGTDAGDYEAIVTVNNKNNCKWDDGTSGDVKIKWKINPIVITKPAAPENLIYNKLTQTAFILQNSAYTITGNTGKDAKPYTATVSLNDKRNYVWDDASSEDLSFTWKICSVSLVSNEETINNTISLGGTLPSPYKDGYKFEGWYTDSDFSGDIITTITEIDGNITLYAKWAPLQSDELIKNNDKNSTIGKKAIAGIAIFGGALLIALIIILLNFITKRNPGGGNKHGGNSMF